MSVLMGKDGGYRDSPCRLSRLMNIVPASDEIEPPVEHPGLLLYLFTWIAGG